MQRRHFLKAVSALALQIASSELARAQPNPPATPQPRFAYDDVVRRARDLAQKPFEANDQPIPEQLAKLDFDALRDVAMPWPSTRGVR